MYTCWLLQYYKQKGWFQGWNKKLGVAFGNENQKRFMCKWKFSCVSMVQNQKGIQQPMKHRASPSVESKMVVVGGDGPWGASRLAYIDQR
jgi:hypothetical protein